MTTTNGHVNQIRERRLALGLDSPEAFAKACGVSVQAVRLAEIGKLKSENLIVSIANMLGWGSDDLRQAMRPIREHREQERAERMAARRAETKPRSPTPRRSSTFENLTCRGYAFPDDQRMRDVLVSLAQFVGEDFESTVDIRFEVLHRPVRAYVTGSMKDTA